MRSCESSYAERPSSPTAEPGLMKNPKLQGTSPKRKRRFGAAPLFGIRMFITQKSPVLRSLEKRTDHRRCHCAGNVTTNHAKHTKESASICVHLRSMNSPCQLQRCVYTRDARSPPNAPDELPPPSNL